MPFDVDKIRKDFPMLKQLMQGKRFIYLDSAATAQKPLVVINAMDDFYRKEYATVHRVLYEHGVMATEKYCETRRLVQQFIGAANEDEIVFTRGATEAINMVVYCYGKQFLKAGDEILITEMEHHANIVPWQFLCEEIGTKLVVAPMDEKGELILEEFEKKLSPRTKIVAITHASNVFGTVNPIKEMIAMAHRVGAVALIDGCQSVPHMPIDVADLNADFFVFSGHKLYGPTGSGVLYGKKEHLLAMRPYHGGGDMIEQVTFAKSTFQPPPLKFEAGTPLIASVLGLGAAIHYLNSLDRPAVLEHEQELLRYATEQLQSVPELRIYGTSAHKSALISFSIEGVHPLDLGTFLSLKGVALRTGSLCAQPSLRHFGLQALTRVSFGLYNTFDEINQFMTHLRSSLALLT